MGRVYTFQVEVDVSDDVSDIDYVCQRISFVIGDTAAYGAGIIPIDEDGYVQATRTRHIGEDGVATTPFHEYER